MKRIALLSILFLSLAFQSYAKDDLTAIVLGHKGDLHSEYYPPADMPEVYFDADNLNNNRTGGDVVVKEGVEYEIEASGTVTLEGGFTVEKGATFAVYPASF